METETQEWQERAIALKADGMESAMIATIVGKHAATVRKVLKRALDAKVAEIEADMERIAMEKGAAVMNGNGHAMSHEEAVEAVEQIRASLPDQIPGQMTVDDHLAPEDEWEREEFIAEAGEAVGPMPPTPPAREMDGGELVGPRLQGTQQMAIDFGPSTFLPREATISFKSEKLESGFFGLGDVVTGTFTARVVAVAGAEKFDKASEEYRAKPQAHVALITEIEVD